MSAPVINASIITIGDELLIGQTIDTNSAFIAQELNKIGVWVRRRVAVGDVYDDIWKALDEEGAASEIVIITGGLGPTADDITKPLLCKYFGGTLVVNEDVKAHVKHLFENVYRRPGALLERNLKQAEVPDVCTVLHNARGTAPGMWFTKHKSQSPTLGGGGAFPSTIYISLPGVPHEMKGLITDQVIPRLMQEFTMPAIVHRTAFTAGQGESMLAEMLVEFEASLPESVKMAYLPNYGMVKLRLTGRGKTKEEVEAVLNPVFDRLLEEVKNFLVTDTDEGLEVVVGRILKAKGLTLGTAESCTGGYIAQLITSVPGSSAYFKGGVVSYANEVKSGVLGVLPETLQTAGAVSEETVRQMIQGAIRTLGVDYAVAVSGIMGPDGGTAEKPVGTVWIAVGNKEKTDAIRLQFRFDRQRNIGLTAVNALNYLRKFILTNS
jgi:nicotinamide-nucleotide amidase